MKLIKLWYVALVGLCLLVCSSACNKGAQQNTTDTDDEAAEANVKKGVKPVADAQVAVIDTDYGRIVIELYPNVAPQMVERFKKLASEGFYNGTTFHRIDPQLGIIQGGDPLSKDNNPLNDGTATPLCSAPTRAVGSRLPTATARTTLEPAGLRSR